MKKVSVIIPCFNDGRYLRESVDSARNQTYPNIEIIVIDDHSTDVQTKALLGQLGAEAGIRLISADKGKKGLPAARNAGILTCSGEYILPLDADDKIAPDFVAKAVVVLESDPSIAVCGSWFRFFGLRHSLCIPPAYAYENILLEQQWLVATALYRRKDWERVGGYDESLVLGKEDMALWLDILRDGAKVHFIEEPLFFYRIKPRSMTAAVARGPTELDKTKALFERRMDLYQEHSFAFVSAYLEKKFETSRRECLMTWKILCPLLRLEWAIRQMVKSVFGRA